jgi:hypothetical protein
MKIIFDIYIASKQPNEHYDTLRKQFDTQVIPPSGIEIEDSAWKDPKIPKSYTINFQQNYIHMNFGVETYQDENRCKEIVNGYRAHDWKPILEWKDE